MQKREAWLYVFAFGKLWVTVDFDTNRGCVGAGWSGTCPSTFIPCELVPIPDQPWVNKDWDLDLDDCDNVGCSE